MTYFFLKPFVLFSLVIALRCLWASCAVSSLRLGGIIGPSSS